MSSMIANSRRWVRLTLLFALAFSVIAQQPQHQAQTDVIRISTELVQGVIVLDKQGRFVESLKPEQFQCFN